MIYVLLPYAKYMISLFEAVVIERILLLRI